MVAEAGGLLRDQVKPGEWNSAPRSGLITAGALGLGSGREGRSVIGEE